MDQESVYQKYCEISRGKKVYLEQSVKEYISKNLKKDFEEKREKKLADTPLRAEIIMTMDIEKSKARVKELVDIYQFLIEDDEQKSWRVQLPVKQEFIEIKK
ncbi:MAG: hypothetical protein ACRCTZ_00940 [Sarcina sp.]